MKYIIKRNKIKKLQLKFIIGIFITLVLLTFVLIVWFSKAKEKDLPNLIYSDKLPTPECSQNGGFYPNAFTLKLVTINPNTHIYYTLDGTEPSLSSNLYIHPFIIESKSNTPNNLSLIPTSPRWKPPIDNVFKGTVLRAVTVDDNNLKSAELVKTFFISDSKHYAIPVVSLTINEKDFFGYKRGIYVLGKSYGDKDNYIRKNISLDIPWWEYPSNYLTRGENAERFAHIEFYEPTGKLGFKSNVGIRINGNATRGYAQKSLRICFKKKYGQPLLKYNLFSDYFVNNFSSFLLRNSGNDWDKTMFRDGLMQSLMENTHVDIQAYRPSIVYINGEYWGIHNIRERFDENYLVNKYHIPADSVTILELAGNLSYGKKGDEKKFKMLLNFVKQNDLSKAQNYEYVKSQIDIQSFSDFIIANIYYCNSDWPNNNVKFWRYKNSQTSNSVYKRDGRWRWMLFDTDWGFGYNNLSTPNNDLLHKAKSTGSVGILFSALIENKSFVAEFTQRFQYFLNTIFSSDYVISQINKMEQTISPEIQEHINRWRVIGSYKQWMENVEELKYFALRRPQLQADQLNYFFKLQGSQRIYIKK